MLYNCPRISLEPDRPGRGGAAAQDGEGQTGGEEDRCGQHCSVLRTGTNLSTHSIYSNRLGGPGHSLTRKLSCKYFIQNFRTPQDLPTSF